MCVDGGLTDTQEFKLSSLAHELHVSWGSAKPDREMRGLVRGSEEMDLLQTSGWVCLSTHSPRAAESVLQPYESPATPSAVFGACQLGRVLWFHKCLQSTCPGRMLGLIARKLKPALVLVGFGIRKSFDVKKALGILRRYMAAYRKDNPKVAFLWLATHAQGCRKPARYRLMQNNDAVLAYNAAMERELRRYVPVPAPACHRPLAHRATLARQSVAALSP